MIVYSSNKKSFTEEVRTNQIEKSILSSFVRETGHTTAKSEIRSWRESMNYMHNLLIDPEIPDDCGVAIEYKIPNTSKRIDFILTGINEEEKSTAILIELKQWSEGIHITDKDAILDTDFYGGGEVNHPSYQVWSYATLLEDYNSNVQDNNINLIPCAYLHNYEQENVVDNDFYSEYICKAPLFLKPDFIKLQDFIKRFMKYGDKRNILYTIENGKIRPSKALADSLSSMLDNNQEFVLIDDQKIVFENAMKLAKVSSAENKNVLIVEGGPGTGKSLVAINLLVELTKRNQVVQYVTKNSAPREVFQIKLSGKFTKTRISNLFTSSGSFINLESNTFDSLIIDEAHRLNAKSGLFSNLGINQIKEIIEASKFSVFFLDESQIVTLKDIGEKSEIEYWAKVCNANIHHLSLNSQFRCNGSDGYIAWLDNILQIRNTANKSIDDLNYDFKIYDNPKQLHDEIIGKNINNKSRLVAGYCWDWISKRNSDVDDIVIDDFSAKWNLDKHGQAWIIHQDSVTEVGCIHTCQGLELDYVGVIIGPDLIVRGGKIITNPDMRAKTDKSINGYKKMTKENSEYTLKLCDIIIKNTYRTLMTRGMKGCYIYSTDKETQEYFKDMLNHQNDIYGDNLNSIGDADFISD